MDQRLLDENPDTVILVLKPYVAIFALLIIGTIFVNDSVLRVWHKICNY